MSENTIPTLTDVRFMDDYSEVLGAVDWREAFGNARLLIEKLVEELDKAEKPLPEDVVQLVKKYVKLERMYGLAMGELDYRMAHINQLETRITELKSRLKFSDEIAKRACELLSESPTAYRQECLDVQRAYNRNVRKEEPVRAAVPR